MSLRGRFKRSAGSTKKPSKQSGFRSGFEKKVAKSLESLGAPVVYEQSKLKYTVPESKHTYTPDFDLPTGAVVEAKGNFSSADRKKMLNVKRCNPNVRIYLLFMRDNTLSKASSTKYSDWAKKHGFEYHVSVKGEVPKHWLGSL